MASHAHKVIPINIRRRNETAEALLELAEAAARGEIIGVAYTVIRAQGDTVQGVVGAARENRALAHYGAARLSQMLLWLDERYRIKR